MKDRILGAGMLLVIVGVIAFAAVNSREISYVTGERFDLTDRYALAREYPGGRFMPSDQNPLYYRVCLGGIRWRLYPDGYSQDTAIPCWK